MKKKGKTEFDEKGGITGNITIAHLLLTKC